MKKLLTSSLVAITLATGANAWDFCSDESQIAISAGSMGVGVAAMYSAAGGVPGLIAGAVINQLLCTPSDTTNSTEPKVLIDSALKTVSIKDAKTVYFDYDKYSLNENGKMDVRTTAAVLKTIPSIPIRIEGNADSRGSDEYNYALGLKRANAVKQALINEGVVNPLQIVSYGESQPTCTSSTEDCLSKNRRVEFKTVE